MLSIMADIQNCAKPYKCHILSVLRPFYDRFASMSFPLHFQSGGIVCTEFYGRKVSRALSSNGSSMIRKYIVILVKIYYWESL